MSAELAKWTLTFCAMALLGAAIIFKVLLIG